MSEDPTNVVAASIIFHLASLSDVNEDPLSIVPDDLLDDETVLLNRVGYLRQKDPPESWRQLADTAFQRHPDNQVAKRMAGEALIDSALSGGALFRGSIIPDEELSKLRTGAQLLQELWDEVRGYENASGEAWTVVGTNLITAYRALGDLDSAKRIADQLANLNADDPDIRLSRALVAMDSDDEAAVISLVRELPESRERTMMLLAAWSHAENWPEIVEFATSERRRALNEDDAQGFDVMLFRAQHASDVGFDLDQEAEALLAKWPLSAVAHVIVADVYKRKDSRKSAEYRAKALSLLTPQSSFAHRVMFAQLALFEEAWDEVIAALDGHVSPTSVSEPLGWLAVAFANAAIRPRTKEFFSSLAPEVIGTARFARLAGAAEHNRGDLAAAEAHLRAALADDPGDLRAVLLLLSALERDNRASDAKALVESIRETDLRGSADDLMRLALILRKHGHTERALTLGYRTAANNRQNEDVISSYPTLIFFDEALPEDVARRGPIGENYWFSLVEEEGGRVVEGVIDREDIPGVTTFAPDHGLVTLLQGKSVGDSVRLEAEFGPDRQFTIGEVKHKAIWLLHDIMATHATRFPEGRSLVEVSMKDGDVQPVLDMVKDLEERGQVITNTYKDFPVPAAAVAAMSGRSVVVLAEHWAQIGENLRTCIGSHEERAESSSMVRSAKGEGAILDTLTFWFAHQAKVLIGLKEYFGRLLIPRSTLDELVELRGKAEINRGREYMTMGFEGDQPWRRVHTPEETEAQITAITAVISDAQSLCEIMPVDGGHDLRLHEAIGPAAAAKIVDPIQLALAEKALLLSDDLNLRQFAHSCGVTRSAWLQVALNEALQDGFIEEDQFLRTVGMLGAYRHDHVWLNANMLLGLAELEEPAPLAYFTAASEFIGGRKAEIRSHFGVMLEFGLRIWQTKLPTWQQGRAMGQLLEKLLRYRSDGKDLLHILDRGFRLAELQGGVSGSQASQYLEDWVRGHFYDLAEIRSLNPQIEMQVGPDAEAPRSSKRKGRKRRGRRLRR